MSLIAVDDRSQCALSFLSFVLARGTLFVDRDLHITTNSTKLIAIPPGLLLYQKKKGKNFHRPNNFGELPFARNLHQVLSSGIPVYPEYQ